MDSICRTNVSTNRHAQILRAGLVKGQTSKKKINKTQTFKPLLIFKIFLTCQQTDLKTDIKDKATRIAD